VLVNAKAKSIDESMLAFVKNVVKNVSAKRFKINVVTKSLNASECDVSISFMPTFVDESKTKNIRLMPESVRNIGVNSFKSIDSLSFVRRAFNINPIISGAITVP
jgi:UDP-N-acetyl-D-mannosaminuronate dehydrogenase